MTACEWAGCSEPAYREAGGFWHCPSHLRDHYALEADEDRHFRRPVGRYGPIPTEPHGTGAAYKRHQRRGEPPCDACRIAESDRLRKYRQARTVASRRRAVEHGLSDPGRYAVAVEVQRLVAAGVSDRAIAALLSVSRHTVSVFRTVDLRHWAAERRSA